MKIRRTKPTMKQQLFLFFMLAAVLVCLIFSAYYFVSEQRVLRNNLERENTKNLQYAIEKIEENAMRVEEFANQICQNGQIRPGKVYRQQTVKFFKGCPTAVNTTVLPPVRQHPQDGIPPPAHISRGTTAHPQTRPLAPCRLARNYSAAPVPHHHNG